MARILDLTLKRANSDIWPSHFRLCWVDRVRWSLIIGGIYGI